jgi:hypothetical protein
MKPALAILALTTPATPALADGTATWLWDVTTQDGDALVEPGETATITLSLLMELALGDGPFVALAATMFDTIGMAGADNGDIAGWFIHYPLAEIDGDTTTTDGVSLFNSSAIQLTVGPPFSSDNPIAVITFEWEPAEHEMLNVEYTTYSFNPEPHAMYVWEGADKQSADAVTYDVTEAAITFTVIPAPPAAFFALPALAFTCRRSRQ